MHTVTSYPFIDLISARCFTIQFFTHPFDTTWSILSVDKSLLEFLITKTGKNPFCLKKLMLTLSSLVDCLSGSEGD